AWRDVFDFTEPCVASIKHSNPCGIAVGADLAEAHRKAHACDPESAFGGVIAANGVVTGAAARGPEWRQVDGGVLLQTPDLIDAAADDPAHWVLKAGPPAAREALADLGFAWRACRAVKSNAILLA